MRKVSVVWSSPNPDGLTASSKNQFVRGLEESGVEIPASITAVEFYRKMGYAYKNGKKELDEGQVYRLEKFR